MATKSQKGMSWSTAAAEKAKANNKYIKVGGNGGYLAISGAAKMFEKDPNFVYIPQMRLAGNINDVRTVINKYGAGPDAANAALGQAITSQNYQTSMSSVYKSELAAYERTRATLGARTTKSVRQSRYSLKDLDWMVKDLQAVQFVPKQSTNKTGAKSPQVGKATRTRGTKKTMLERMTDAQSRGKVLDVSNLDKGVIRAAPPPTGPRSKKIHIPGLAIMASRDKFTNYEAAVRQLGTGYESYIEHFKTAILPMQNILSPSRSPNRVSPRMQHLSTIQPLSK